MASVLEHPTAQQHGVTPTTHINQTPSLEAQPSSELPVEGASAHQKEDTKMVAGIFSPTASGTPPESPHQTPRNPFSMRASVAAGGKSPTNATAKQSRRATYAGGDSLTPTRAAMAAVGVTGGGEGGASDLLGIEGGGGSFTNSPIPPPSNSVRLQPSSATAPVVGRHKKTNSLVGFDPLLDSASLSMDSNDNHNLADIFQGISLDQMHEHNVSNHIGVVASKTKEAPLLAAPHTPVTPVRSPVRPKAKAATTAAVAAAPLADLNLSLPPSPSTKDAEQELSNELRKLAKNLSASSPQRPTSAKVSKSKFSLGASLTPKFTLTPPFRSSEKGSALTSPAGGVKEPLSAQPQKSKLKWRHRRTQSLEAPDESAGIAAAAAAMTDASLQHRTGSFEQGSSNAFMPGGDAAIGSKKVNISGTNSNRRASTTAIPNSPMMQDLYDVVTAQAKQDAAGVAISNLALPSLAKPAPTSFLTGKEIVRSSEQDPSPFQMEIPSLEQTLVSARLNQFVEVYRKEDLNLDLNMSLVGVNRMQLNNFVSADSNSPPPPQPLANLTDAHRPLVEALIEAADDVTVSGFFAGDNAASADTRREAVCFERQMQFVVVFRGTTPEQSAKTPFFKKHNKQHLLETLEEDIANADCKVYSAVKQAYMGLEKNVFDCLDKYLDENPFCEVVFTGHSLGGSMATLAAFRYATNRPMVRVHCQIFGSPKVGNRVFRQQANSLPNLKVMRVEYASDPKCFAPPGDANGSHVGHSIVLSKKSETNNAFTAAAYKFDDDHDTRKHQPSKPNIIMAAFKKERDITSYASSLEQLHQSKDNWVSDFKGEDGTGVRGKDNEQRQVV